MSTPHTSTTPKRSIAGALALTALFIAALFVLAVVTDGPNADMQRINASSGLNISVQQAG